MKIKTKITKEELRKIAAGARRAVDIELGIGLNNRHTIFTDKKKKADKEKCRKKKD
jgi:hypothetical protein